MSYAIIHVVADDLEDVEDFCYDCYQKFKDCELLNSYEQCNCYDLCDSDVCCDFVSSGMVIITPPSIKQCDCSVLCADDNCCKYIDNDTGAMPTECEDCADAVRDCNNNVKLKSNKTTILACSSPYYELINMRPSYLLVACKRFFFSLSMGK